MPLVATARRQAVIRYITRRPDPSATGAPRPHKRVRVPTVLQMEAVECGAAALAMVLSAHGRVVPLEELRAACGVSRDGSKASNLLRAARSYGLTAKGFKKEPADLRALPVPMIVHWNFNHFLVLEGIKDGKAYLNDPASGPRVVGENEFDEAFTGVALVFEKGPEFKPGGARPSVIGGLKQRLPGSGAALAFVMLAGLALVLPGIVAPAFNRVFVDNVVVKGMSDWLRPLLFAMGAAALVHAGLVYLEQQYLLRLETKLSLGSSSAFVWHVLRLPVEFFNQRYAGEIGNRVGLNDRIARLLSGDLATNAINVAVVAFYGALMLRYDVWLTFLGVGMALINVAALKYVSRRRSDLNQKLLQDRGRLMGTAMGGLQTIETLKASGAESDFFAQWAGYQAKVANGYQELQMQTMVLSAVPPLLMALNTALLLGIGGMRVMSGALSMGMLTAFQALMASFSGPINRMVDLGGAMQEVQGDINRLDDVLSAKPDRTPIGEAEAPSEDGVAKLSGALELRDITFGYSKLDAPLIEHFHLNLRPGSRVALVGGSGCGKSTLAKLVAGLYSPWTGDICFDGVTRGDVPRSVLAGSFAVVDQDICLFEDTIKANLTLWDDTVAESDLVQAARDACIHEDIVARPGAYTSVVAEGGRNFSGGQRQRLEIARALVNNPTIIVLDEATSALDPTTERIIDDNLRRRGVTCLIVAHRLSTIRDCDEIVVLDGGRVVQRGTHDALRAIEGPYRALVSAE